MGSWFRYYLELRRGHFRLSESLESRERPLYAVRLDGHVMSSVQDKRLVCVQMSDCLHVFRTKTELDSRRWFEAFARQTLVGPVMEGGSRENRTA